MYGQTRPQQNFVLFDFLLVPNELFVNSSFRSDWVLYVTIIDGERWNLRLGYTANSLR